MVRLSVPGRRQIHRRSFRDEDSAMRHLFRNFQMCSARPLLRHEHDSYDSEHFRSFRSAKLQKPFPQTGHLAAAEPRVHRRRRGLLFRPQLLSSLCRSRGYLRLARWRLQSKQLRPGPGKAKPLSRPWAIPLLLQPLPASQAIHNLLNT